MNTIEAKKQMFNYRKMILKRMQKRNIFSKIWDYIWFHFIIKENEFHPSLDLNPFKLSGMNPKKRDKYISRITKLRSKAHRLDIYYYDNGVNKIYEFYR